MRTKTVVNMLPAATALMVVLLGTVVIFGWHTRQATLIQISPQFVAMQYNTALGFVMSGLALISLWKDFRRVAALFGAITVLIGSLSGLQYLIGTDFGIDQFFMDPYITVETSHPGRMAPNTALSFVLVGSGMLVATSMRDANGRQWANGLVGSVVLGVGLVAFAGYAAGLAPAYSWGVSTRMAVHTAAGFSLLGFGFISLACREELAREDSIENLAPWWSVSAAIFVVSFTALLADALESHEQTLFEQMVEPTHTIAPSVVQVFGVIMGILLGTTLWFSRRSRLRAIGAEKLAKSLIENRANLAEINAQFQSAFEGAIHGMVIVTPEGNFLRVNRAFCNITGYTEDELLKTNSQRLTHPDDRTLGPDAVQRFLDGELKSIQVEKRYIHKDGHVIPAQLGVSLVRDIDGNLLHYVAQIQDLTALKESEHRLRQSQKMEAVGQLTGGVAHDFNNLLAIIEGNLSILGDDLDEDRDLSADDLRETIMPALHASRRGAELTHRLLAFSRKQALQPVALDINAVVQGMEGLLKRTLGEDIDLSWNLEAAGWLAKADAPELESVLLNLALNARDAMSAGGKLTIETGEATLDDDYAASHADVGAGEYLMLAVSDTGIGMDAETLEKVFEPFYTTKDVGHGTGLGLSMAYGFAKQSGGHVTLYSEAGEGTTVKLYLPRTIATDTEVPENDHGAATEGGDETILVIEDDDDVRDMTVRILGRLGYRVLEADDGQSTFAILAEEDHIDLLLSDVVLPGGLSGPEIAKSALEKAPGLKILFMSGYTENAILHQGRIDKGVNLLSKPFSHTELSANVRKALDKAS